MIFGKFWTICSEPSNFYVHHNELLSFPKILFGQESNWTCFSTYWTRHVVKKFFNLFVTIISMTWNYLHKPNFEKERLLYKFFEMIGNIRANFSINGTSK